MENVPGNQVLMPPDVQPDLFWKPRIEEMCIEIIKDIFQEVKLLRAPKPPSYSRGP